MSDTDAILRDMTSHEPDWPTRAPRSAPVLAKDLSIIVRVHGRPELIKAFQAADAVAAAEHAAKYGGMCEPLPVSDPVWDWAAGRMCSGPLS